MLRRDWGALMTTGGWTDLLSILFGGFVQLQVNGLFAAAVLAIPVSFATLWMYRRRIARSLEPGEIADHVTSWAPRGQDSDADGPSDGDGHAKTHPEKAKEAAVRWQARRS